MKNAICKSFLLLSVLFLSSCASIVSKSTYPVMITSNPGDAEVEIINKRGHLYAEGITPLTVRLKAGSSFFSQECYTVNFRKPGYRDVSLMLTCSIDGWYFGNLLLGGLIGMLIIDPATGAMWKLDYDVLHARMTPLDTAELTLIDIKDATEEMKQNMVRIK